MRHPRTWAIEINTENEVPKEVIEEASHNPISELQVERIQQEAIASFIGKDWKYKRGDLVKKREDKGQWRGRVVGFYSTNITVCGYAVESAFEPGSVQIYPESALKIWSGLNNPDL